MARKSLSKKTRFDIFKRDGFKCQYCGATPPKVILHVDHIDPVALGGKNDPDNLITSCENCNLGKGARPLSSVPQSLPEKAEEMAEREAQLLGYRDVIQEIVDRQEQDAWRVADALEPGAEKDGIDKARFKSIKMFLKRLPYHEVLEAAQLAELSKPWSTYPRFKYFCGICWNKIKRAEANG